MTYDLIRDHETAQEVLDDIRTHLQRLDLYTHDEQDEADLVGELVSNYLRVRRIVEKTIGRAAKAENDLQIFQDATDGDRASQRAKSAEMRFEQLQKFTRHLEQERDQLRKQLGGQQ